MKIGIIGILNRHTYPLTDPDLWGLTCALEHGLDDGYFKENSDWAKAWVAKINELRNDMAEV